MILKMPEFVENPEARCPVMLALDSSQSMAGAPMRELLAGIQTFRNAIQEDELASLRVEFAITTVLHLEIVAKNNGGKRIRGREHDKRANDQMD